TLLSLSLFPHCSRARPHRPPSPTRRSSDLIPIIVGPCPVGNAAKHLRLLLCAYRTRPADCSHQRQHEGESARLYVFIAHHSHHPFRYSPAPCAKKSIISLTSSSATVDPEFPQLVRSWLMMAAISAADSSIMVPIPGMAANSGRAS